MKKLVALLLCLMMVVPATLASAETAEGKVLNSGAGTMNSRAASTPTIPK